jgi:hypothetical protein
MNYKHSPIVKKKKGQIFMMDGIFSFIIIVVAIAIISSFYTKTISNENTFEYAQNILNKFTTTPINTLNNKEIRELFVAGKITNVENTIAQQVVLFYNRGGSSNLELAQNLTQLVISSYEKKGIFLNISLINSSGGVFNLYTTSPLLVSSNESTYQYQLTREVLAFEDNFTVVGPNTIQLQTWS